MFSMVNVTVMYINGECKMATRKVKLKGIAEWAKVFAENRDLTGYKPTPSAEGSFEKYNGACTIDLILDDANIAALQASGCTKKPKPDQEGRGHRVKLDRKFDTGQDYSSGAPIVQHPDGTPWDLHTDGLIGNGSIVEVIATVYDVIKYGIVGTRLDTVIVLDHKPVEGGDIQVFSADTVSNAASVPSSPKADALPNDEILF